MVSLFYIHVSRFELTILYLTQLSIRVHSPSREHKSVLFLIHSPYYLLTPDILVVDDVLRICWRYGEQYLDYDIPLLLSVEEQDRFQRVRVSHILINF